MTAVIHARKSKRGIKDSVTSSLEGKVRFYPLIVKGVITDQTCAWYASTQASKDQFIT